MRIRQLVPVLSVRNLDAEVAFYQAFGFTIHYQGDDLPDFVALSHGAVLFGLERLTDFRADEANRVLLWQFEVDDLAEVMSTCAAHGYQHTAPRRTWESGDDWAMTTWSPNGYRVQFEGPPPRSTGGTS